MAKFLNRLKARLAREILTESAKEGKNWIVSKKLIMETEEGDVEALPGDTVEVGADEEGNMVVGSKAAVVIITDPEIAEKVAEVVVNADELSDVEFVQRDAMDALDDGEAMDDVVEKLGDSDDETIETAEMKVEACESVEEKYDIFARNIMHPTKALICESILVDENANDYLNVATVKMLGTLVESYEDYSKFTSRVSSLKGSIQPGKREIALSEAGKPMGFYDTEAEHGELYPDHEFDSVEAMDSYDNEPVSVMDTVKEDEWVDTEAKEPRRYEDMTEEEMEDWAAGEDAFDDEDMIECSLKKYEESAQSGEDYMSLVESLSSKKLGLKESAISKIAGTFAKNLNESCVKVFDTKLGVYCASFKESVECNNFIAETKDEGRFTKRFFN